MSDDKRLTADELVTKVIELAIEEAENHEVGVEFIVVYEFPANVSGEAFAWFMFNAATDSRLTDKGLRWMGSRGFDTHRFTRGRA